MEKTKFGLRLPDVRIIDRDMSGLALGLLALLLFTGVLPNCTVAAEQQAKDPNAVVDQAPPTYVDEEEEKSYRAAKQEPDPKKRAAMLLAFTQKYPKSVLMEKADFESIKSLEVESNEFDAASKEPDLDSRASKLVEFVQKHPGSALAKNVDFEYRKMLADASQGKKYELLESLAEKWLRLHPNDKDGYGLIAEAACGLKKYDKCGKALEEVYKAEALPSVAKEILLTYQEAENPAKQNEWAEKLFKMPEFEGDYMLRFAFVKRYSKENNLPKAAEYAHLTLMSADLARQPDANTQAQLKQVRRACYHVIATDLMEKEKYTEAIAAFREALKMERYAQGYYEIGLCLDNLKKVEAAILYYSIAELMGGDDAPKAKARLEALYKAMHNDTLIGIEKVYIKAKQLLAQPES